MFRKVLIANRGEIAVRVIRACRMLGLPTVAVHSVPDADALHVRLADEAVCIGPAAASRSYLNTTAVLSAASITGADAIHPGYGFLAEDAGFARQAADAGLCFVGPDPAHLSLFGDKLRAKQVAREAGLPLLHGSDAVDSAEAARAVADRMGWPVMLKAAGGGGGRGMRAVRRPAEMDRCFDLCASEARAFGAAELFVEPLVERPRHVEVQVAGDGRGAVIHLGTRDCSLQRRHQKLIEEAQAPIDPSLRHRIECAATALLGSLDYRTVATVEFLVRGDAFWFLEVNPRIQVEHPVTEAVTGVDLVVEQLRLAAGEGLSVRQEEVRVSGHAIEARINAEHPWTLRPCPGRVDAWQLPGGPGIRVDTALSAGAVVSPHYDSLVAKVIAWAPTRPLAIRRLGMALAETAVTGIDTTLPLLRALVGSPAFQDGAHTTATVGDELRVSSR